jgi:hypothetical protein
MVDQVAGFGYRALRRLSTKDNVTLAHEGETCEHVPASSLPALLRSGKIVPITTITEADWQDLGGPMEGQG